MHLVCYLHLKCSEPESNGIQGINDVPEWAHITAVSENSPKGTLPSPVNALWAAIRQLHALGHSERVLKKNLVSCSGSTSGKVTTNQGARFVRCVIHPELGPTIDTLFQTLPWKNNTATTVWNHWGDTHLFSVSSHYLIVNQTLRLITIVDLGLSSQALHLPNGDHDGLGTHSS